MEQPKQKPTIAIESVTGCAGCQLNIYFQEHLMEILEHFDLVSAPMIKRKNEYSVVDVLFLEGTVVNQGDLEKVKAMREKCKILVAIGECACHGNVPLIKYSQDKKGIDVIKASYENPISLKGDFQNIDPIPIDKIVKVDYYIKGCPMDKKEFENFVKDFLLGKKIQQFNQPMCYYCTLKENDCILERGEKCLGPIIDGNCSVICPSYGIGCTGCRGFIEDSNLRVFIDRLKENNFSDEEIQNNLHKYAVLQYEEMFKIQTPASGEIRKETRAIIAKPDEQIVVKEERKPFWKRIFEKREREKKIAEEKKEKPVEIKAVREEKEKKSYPIKKLKTAKKKEIKKPSKSKTSKIKKENKGKKEKTKQLNLFESIKKKFSKKK